MKTTRHATYDLDYHIVWVPESRRPVLTGEVADRVDAIIREVAADKGLDIDDLAIQADHVHLVVSSPPKHSPALLANWFKGISSRKYNHRHADHADEKIRWARGYYAGTAGHVAQDAVEQYIQTLTDHV